MNGSPKVYYFILYFKSNILHGETGKMAAVYGSDYTLSHFHRLNKKV